MVIIASMTMSIALPVISVSATPTEVQEARNKYAELETKIAELNTQIEILDDEMSKLTDKINSNKAEIKNLNNQIENTEKEIAKTKEEISEKENILGARLRELYKSGGETDYISIILSAESFSDLITKIDAANRIIKLDQNIIDEVKEIKEKLDKKVTSLNEKSNEIKKLNSEVEKQADKVKEKMNEQEKLIAKTEAEQAKFDAEYLSVVEMELVQAQIDILYNSNSSYDDLNNTITNLRLIRDNQIKSPTVVEKINEAIEYAKPVRDEKKAELERLAAEEAARQEQIRQEQIRQEQIRQEQIQQEQNSSSNNSSSSSSSSSSNNNSSSNSGSSNSTPTPPPASGSVQAVINEAYKHLGKSYVWGAKGPDTFDCSGFTSYVYRHATGIEIGGSTYVQINAGIEVSPSNIQPGDLIFPHDGHVGIYLGNNQMIHAPRTGDVVKIVTISNNYVWRARRILY